MATDPTTTAESLVANAVDLIKHGADLNVVLKNVAETAANAGLNFADLTAKFIKAKFPVEKITEIFSKFGAEAKKLGDIFEALKGKGDISGFVEKNANLIGTLVRALIPPSQELSNVLKQYEKSSATFGLSLGETGKSIQQYSAILNGITGDDKLGSLLQGLTNIGAGADQAKQLENTFLGVSAAAGDLGGTLRKTLGEDFGNLDKKMEEFSKLTGQIGTATGTNALEVMKYALQLKQIPGAMEETVRVSTEAGGTLGALEAIIKVSRGTYQDTGEVISTLNGLFKTLGTNTENALKIVSKMYEVGQSIKMPADVMKTYVTGAATAFKFLGDNTLSAMNIMEKMGGTLRAAGMGPQAVQEIVSGYLRGIETMDIAHKSFISGKTGGPGGLMGGFQLEQMLKEGKGEDVSAKVNQAMKSMFGGKIVDLKEASQSQGAASQMVKQVELLKSFNLAQDKDQAYGVIAALKAGRELPEAKTPQQALEKAVQDGNAITARQDTKLTEVVNQLIIANTSASIRTAAALRMAVGSEGKFTGQLEPGRRAAAVEALNISKNFATSPGAEKTGLTESFDYFKKSTMSLFDQLSGAKDQMTKEPDDLASMLGPKTARKKTNMNLKQPAYDRATFESRSVMPGTIMPDVGSTTPPEATATVKHTVETAARRNEEKEFAADRGGRTAPETRTGTAGTINIHITTELGQESLLKFDSRTGDLIRETAIKQSHGM
jgi:hypothetical protein